MAPLRLLPGLALSLAVAGAALGAAALEQHLFGRPPLEALVLAILIGTAVRTAWRPGERFAPGVQFSAKTLLEVAVALLGATVSAQAILSMGPGLLGGTLALVAAAVAGSYLVGRAFGLAPRMATLVACGNSICGNSAIAAVAPVIEAEGEEVAASIAFTAVLGVAVVLALPLLAQALHLPPKAFGVLAGLTVYAVPQVLAATAPAGALATQVGALVKLVRVLTLGPILLVLAWLYGRGERAARHGPKIGQVAPWFVLSFLALAAARSADLIPHAALRPTAEAAGQLTVVAMAGLGLGVDLKDVARAGPSVTGVVLLSLALITLLALGLIKFLAIA
ncbi:YeiH family protein [Phenylobacterium soli]|uniref:Putative sulfate exporter family transporter n=1 Tax=Phenylobacterium soli TaxID=2170551 RepID=A0A328AF10_9CAUL|nr:putative sulfate exporter family transporter [Phenylobacterium soli]RAK53463.1 putative sulfate exporter family transporter [Phenylobacterium soli]